MYQVDKGEDQNGIEKEPVDENQMEGPIGEKESAVIDENKQQDLKSHTVM